MLDESEGSDLAALGLTDREQGVAAIVLERATRLARPGGPDPAVWLALVLRRWRSHSHEGRIAALLAAMKPRHADVYVRDLGAPLHLSRREVQESLRSLELAGFIRTATTIRTDAIELTLVTPKHAPERESAPETGQSPCRASGAAKTRKARPASGNRA